MKKMTCRWVRTQYCRCIRPVRLSQLSGTIADIAELFNLLINPLHNDFALRWHRDDIGEGVKEAEEKLLLQQWHFGVSRSLTLGPFFALWLSL